jgi:hypothetical protein
MPTGPSSVGETVHVPRGAKHVDPSNAWPVGSCPGTRPRALLPLAVAIGRRRGSAIEQPQPAYAA